MTRQRIYSFFVVLMGLWLQPLRAEPLNLVGTGDGFDVFQALARAYTQANPGADVLVPRSIGSGGAIAAVGAGRERIGRIARPLSPVESASGLVTRPVFDIPSAFYVHPSVPVRQLTAAQVRGIFEGKIINWSALGGPDLRIRVVRREEADSTLTALRASLPEFRDMALSERSKLALTTQDAISSVRDNPGAIGFAPYSVETAAILGVVALNGHLPASPEYPARVKVALLWRDGQPDRDIEAFLAFLATPEAQRVITQWGAIPSGK